MALIEFTGIGLVEVPDDITDEQVQELGENLSKGTVRSMAASAGRSFQESAGRTISGARRAAEYLRAPTQIPVGMGGFGMRDETAKNLLEMNREIAQEQALEPERSESRLSASPTYQLGQEITQQAGEVFQPNPLNQGEFMTDVLPSAAGQLPLLIGAGAVGGPLAAGVVYGASAGQATLEEAEAAIDGQIAQQMQQGNPQEAARLEREKINIKNKAFLAGATIGGVTEGVLGVAGRVVPGLRDATGAATRRIVREAVRGGAREGAQEGLEQVGGNVVAQQLYDPERPLMEGVRESVAAGAILGSGLSGAVESRRPSAPQVAAQQVSQDIAPYAPRTAGTVQVMAQRLELLERNLEAQPETGLVIDADTGQPATFTVPRTETLQLPAPNAIQEQVPTEGVLRPEQPTVELPRVGTENIQEEVVTDVLPTQGKEVITPELETPVQEAIPAQRGAITEETVSEPVPPVEPQPQANIPQPEADRAEMRQAAADLQNLGITPQDATEKVGKYLTARAKYVKNRVVAGFQRNFTSRGDLPESVFREKIKRTGRIKSIEQEGRYLTRDYNRALREVYGLNRVGQETNIQQVPQEDIQKFNAYLTKEDDGRTIDPRIRQELDKMRDYLDNLSNDLIRKGLVDSKLEKVLEGNLGVYLTRSYRFFDDPKWAENIPQERVNSARNFILTEMRKTNPAATEQDADRQVRNMIEDWKKDGVDSFIRGGKLGAKDMYTFFKRKDIAPEIRALLGEYKDPQVNFTRSVGKIARYLGDQQFLNQVKQDGMGQFLFTSENAPPGFNTQIATEGSATMEPLNGLRTSPEIARVFAEYAKEGGQAGTLWKSIMALNALTKTAATVGSIQTQMRNLFGQIYFNTLNGDFRLNNYGKSAKAVLADLGALNDAEWRKRYADYLRLGVVGDSTISQEIRESVKAVYNRDMPEDDLSFRALGHFLKKYGIDKPTEIYQASDDLGKIAAFESRKEDVKAINPTWSNARVEEEAAKQIREDYPTHQMASRAVRLFRKQPLFGSFATFNAEMMRSTYNSLSRTMNYLFNNQGNTAMRDVGIRRAAGALTALGGASYALAALGRMLTGMTPEDEEDVRQFVPEYERDSNLVFTGRSDDGKVRYINESRFNPYSMLPDAVRAMLANDDEGLQKALWEGFLEVTRGYADESLILSKLLDVSRNQTESGRQVYNEEATKGEKIYDSAKHVGEVIVPGTIKRAVTRIYPAATGQENRRGVVPDLGAELARETLGVAIEDIDFERSLEFRAREFPKRISDATSQLTSQIYKRGQVSEQEILDAYQKQEDARFKIWSELANQSYAAIRQGVKRDEVRDILEAGGVSKRDSRLILDGSYRAYRPSELVLERARSRNRSIPLAEIEAIAEERDNLRLSDDIPEPEPEPPIQWHTF